MDAAEHFAKKLNHFLSPGPYDWTFGDRLRKIRRVHNLTQDEFAAVLGVNSKSLAAWEADKWLPRGAMTIAKRLQLKYGISPAWTLGIHDYVDSTKTPNTDDAEADEGLARPEGFEPPTFCLVVEDEADERDADVVDLADWLPSPRVEPESGGLAKVLVLRRAEG